MSKKYQSAVGTITRNCQQYIQEWIIFQHITGFDKIIIRIDSRTVDETLKRIESLPQFILDKVDILPVIECNTEVFKRGEHVFQKFQANTYQDIYDKYKDEIEWLAFFDDDEYLYDKDKRKINDILNVATEDAGSIILPWLNFNHNQRLLPVSPSETRLAAFTKRPPIPEWISIVKSIARMSNIISDNVYDWYYCHTIKTNGSIHYADGRKCFLVDQGIQALNPMKWDTCLVHYRDGSVTDWIKKVAQYSAVEHGASDWYTWKHLTNPAYSCEDSRMSIYIDDLREILQQCKS